MVPQSKQSAAVDKTRFECGSKKPKCFHGFSPRKELTRDQTLRAKEKTTFATPKPVVEQPSQVDFGFISSEVWRRRSTRPSCRGSKGRTWLGVGKRKGAT